MRVGFRLTAALLMALFLGDPLAGILHSALEEHRWCALHGHVVHAHGEAEPTSDARAVAAEEGLRITAGDDCPAILALREGALAGESAAPLPAGLDAPALLPGDADRRVADLLSLAPKHGPPAATA